MPDAAARHRPDSGPLPGSGTGPVPEGVRRSRTTEVCCPRSSPGCARPGSIRTPNNSATPSGSLGGPAWPMHRRRRDRAALPALPRTAGCPAMGRPRRLPGPRPPAAPPRKPRRTATALRRRIPRIPTDASPCIPYRCRNPRRRAKGAPAGRTARAVADAAAPPPHPRRARRPHAPCPTRTAKSFTPVAALPTGRAAVTSHSGRDGNRRTQRTCGRVDHSGVPWGFPGRRAPPVRHGRLVVDARLGPDVR